MGEPLLNFDNVVAAMQIMQDDFCFGLSRRRITLSTAGVVPAIDRLKEACPVSLAVSLHAPNNQLRDRLVPVNKKYPIEQLLDACRRYVEDSQRSRITFEYVMLQEVNDEPGHAEQLAEILKDVPSKINLIPFNPFKGSEFKRSSNNRIYRFRDYLHGKGLVTTIRKTRGDDIAAACGQLAGMVTDRTKRSQRYLQGLGKFLSGDRLIGFQQMRVWFCGLACAALTACAAGTGSLRGTSTEQDPNATIHAELAANYLRFRPPGNCP